MSNPASANELVFLPLGGAGEIGMNLNLYGFGPEDRKKWILVDLGVTFGDGHVPGVDIIMPDPAFIEERRDDLLAIILTHGHEDHIGAVAHLWPRLRCPIYATPFTANLVRYKLAEAGLDRIVKIDIVELGARFRLGPFDLELVTLTHSIPEPNALAIRTEAGTVLHTGDWKIDPDPLIGDDIDIKRLQEIGEEGVLAIVCDSTNVFSPGTSGSEADVAIALKDILARQTGRVAITTFASNVARLQSIAEAAAACDRHVVLVGRAMHRVVAAAREAGYLQDLPPFVGEEESGHLPHDKVLYLCTGSQGEPRAALARIASDTHPHIYLEAGDLVIFSSRVIPGNEIMIFDLQNQLAERGIRVMTDRDHLVHVSGHPCRDELARMYQWIRPKVAIPVHGEARHLLEHANLARELQIPQSLVIRNGLMARLAPGEAEIIDEVPSGRLYLDGEILLPADEVPVQMRRKLGFAGAAFVTLVLGGDGKLRGDVAVRLLGLPEFDGDGVALAERLEDAAIDALEQIPVKRRKDEDQIAETIRRAVRAALRRAWGKKTMVEVVVNRV